MKTIETEENINFNKVWLMFQETDKKFQDTDRKFQDTDRKFQDTDKQLKELGKQIGGLGNKFGSYTEGLFYPSLKRILQSKFHVTNVIRNSSANIGNNNIEIDVVGYSNGANNTAFIVEIKSHLQEKHISQTLNILEKFRTFFPEHKDKKIYGMIASVNYTEDLKELVLDNGLYFAKIHDETFKLDIPDEFKPKQF